MSSADTTSADIRPRSGFDDAAAEAARAWLGERGVTQPVGAFVFGSGWSPLAERIRVDGTWRYGQIPGFFPTSVDGHPGNLVWGTWEDVPCVAFVGRWHLYEGRTWREAALPARIAAALGCRWMMCTNAAGGIASFLRIGKLVAIVDDLCLWSGGMVGAPGQRTRSSGATYSPRMLKALSAASLEANIPIEQGTLAMMPGPNYETASEIAMLRSGGASVVSMSTVPEARCARSLGLEVAALSCVTNLTPGRPANPILHEEVLGILTETGKQAGRLIEAWLTQPYVRTGIA